MTKYVKPANRCRPHLERKTRRRAFWVLAVSEIVLLRVGVAEDVVPDQIHHDDRSSGHRAEFDRVECQIAGLEGVHKGDPRQVTYRQHVPKSIRGDIHRRENRRLDPNLSTNPSLERENDTYLIVQRIDDVPRLEREDEPEGVGHLREPATPDGLLAEHADVDQHPQDHARPELVEVFEIKRTDGRVQFASDEELRRGVSA